jgi:hypothetical protein
MIHIPSFAKVVHSTITLLRFPGVVTIPWPLLHMAPLAPCEPGRVTTPITQSSKQGTLPTMSLISRQAVPYRTCDATCHHGVSTAKTRSLADLSIIIHTTWWNPTVSTVPTYAQTIASILTMVSSHLDGWEMISHKDTSQTQHHKGWKDLYDTHDYMAKHN